MAGGGLSVITPLIKLMLMWRVDSWALSRPQDMETCIPWGMIKIIVIIINDDEHTFLSRAENAL